MEQNKIFDDYYVDCNECQHYWNDTCDGVPSNKERACTSFIATTKVDLPKKLNALEKKVQFIGSVLMVYCIVSTLVLIRIIFGG